MCAHVPRLPEAGLLKARGGPWDQAGVQRRCGTPALHAKGATDPKLDPHGPHATVPMNLFVMSLTCPFADALCMLGS